MSEAILLKTINSLMSALESLGEHTKTFLKGVK